MSLNQLPDADDLLVLVRDRVSPKTAAHSICTAEFMVAFAVQAGIAEHQAFTAGLLHDLQKDTGSDALLSAAKKYNIPTNPVQQQHPKLLHGPVAAEECRHELKIADDDVINAIYWHTTGRPQWNDLGLALYFADYAEPLRMFPEAVTARELLKKEGFWPALKYAADAKLRYIKTKKDIDPITADFQQWLHERLAK